MTYYVYMMSNKWHTVIYTGMSSDLEGLFGNTNLKKIQLHLLPGIIAINLCGMLKLMMYGLPLKKKKESKQVPEQRKLK